MTPIFFLELLFSQKRGIRPGSAPAYLMAVAIVAAATMLRLLLSPWVVGVQFITFFPAVIVACFVYGVGAGLFTIALSAVSVMLFIMPGPHTYQQVGALSLFILGAIVWVCVIPILRAAIRSLHDSEMRYRMLADNTTDLIVLQDVRGKNQYISPACRKILGYEPQETTTLSLEMLVHPDDMAGLTAASRGLSKDRPRVTSIHRIRRKDGSFAWVEGLYNWIEEGSEGQPQIMCVIRDISGHRAAEDAVSRTKEEAERTEALLIDAIDASDDGIALYDSQDRLVLLNKAISQNRAGRGDLFVLGRTYEEIVRAYWEGTDLVSDAEAFDRFIIEDVERHQRGDGMPNERRLGERIWLVDRSFRTRDGGILQIRTNMSALKLAKEEAEKANLLKSRFLAAASHDLRQPLQSISLIQGILQKTATDPQSQSVIEKLGTSIDAMSDMLDTLLELNQLESGVVTPALEDFPIGDLLSRIRSELRYQAEAKGLDLRLVHCDAIVHSDPKLLEQILRNLLANAIKYTNRGKILLGCRQRSGVLRISVLDTGIGIEHDQVEAIFEEFRQIDNPARDRRRGLGLGLAIVQRLSGLLGHRVDVRSTPHRGSVFSVEVPLGHPCFTAVSHTVRLADSGPAMRIFLVEDDPMVREALQVFLEFQGHQLICAADAESALRHLADTDWRPDVIISDFNLPGEIDGLALIESVRQRLFTATPGIVLTGDITLTDETVSSVPGCMLLRKPADRDAINAALRALRSAQLGAVPVMVVA
jgi:PAS domain S-box-containing protein